MTSKPPLPGYFIASTGSTVPPKGVQARPLTTPISGSFPIMSSEYFSTPRKFCRFSSVIVASVSLPSAFASAVLRQIEAIFLSSSRTPASQVYDLIKRSNALSVKSRFVSSIPLSFFSFGMRCFLAIFFFSKVV